MAQPKWPLRQRVEVEWRDSSSQGNWASTEQYRKERHFGPCRSIGYVIDVTKDRVHLAQSQSPATQHIADTVHIPRESVIRMKRLRGGLS